jgi:hypothetical protein
VAELTADAELLAISEFSEVTVSLEHLRGIDPRTRVRIGAGLYYEGDEGPRIRPDSGSAVATILPEGTVVPSAWHPGKTADSDLWGSIIRKTTYVAPTRTCNVSVNVVIKP